jgi:hypothetical protein
MRTLCALAGAVWLAAAMDGFATQRYVPSGGTFNYPTIQSAVNVSVTGDVIWVQPGTYAESITFRSMDITLTSMNPNDTNVVQNTIIVGNGTRSTVTIAGGQTSKTLFTGFTVRGGGGNSFYSTYLAGGAIYCSNTSPRIVANIVESNQMVLNLTNMNTVGGGVFVFYGSPTISRNVFRDNQANIGGAIVSLYGAPQIQDNCIYQNNANYGGGGVYVSDSGLFLNNTLLENTPDNAYVDTTALMADNIFAHLGAGYGVIVGPSAGDLSTWFKYNDVWETNGVEIMQTVQVGTNYNTVYFSAAGTNGNLDVDPQFVDATNFDLRLTAPSLCINAGDLDGLRSTNEVDILGNTRVFALRVDMGAYEFNGARTYPPIAHAGPDQTVYWNGSDAITMDGSNSVDPNGDSLQYRWNQMQGPPVTIVASNSQALFIPNGLGEYRFNLIVNNGVYDSTPDEIRILVTNLPPIASAGFSQSMLVIPQIVALDGSHSMDPKGAALTYHWRQTQGPSAQLLGAAQARAAFIPAGAGAYEFELTVSNLFSASTPSRATFYLGVVPPVANAGPTRYAGRASITLDGSGSFVPNTNAPLTYSWRQLSGPPATFLSATNVQKPTLRAFTQTTNVQEAVFELTVSAGGLTSAPATVKVVIVPAWGNNAISQINGAFNTNRPTIIGFSGGNCDTGGAMSFPSSWYSLANLFTLSYSRDTNSSTSDPRYFGYGDQMIVILSASAPGYNQPIQTMGWSTGNMPACDVAERFNILYRDPRYRVNRISFFDTGCGRDYNANISNLMSNRESGVMFWVDNYYAVAGTFRSGVLNVQFPAPPAAHNTPNDWYFPSWTMGSAYNPSTFNNGVFAGAFFSVIGPGKNYQLDTSVSEYFFGWTNGTSSSYTSFPINTLSRISPTIYPARLPGVVQLSGPTNGALATPRRTPFSCSSSVLNAVKYQILIGPDAQHVATVVWEGSVRPTTNTLLNLPWGRTWWTIRVADAYGTTSWADPRYVLRDTDADGLSDEAEVLVYHTDPDNADTDGDGHTDGQEIMAGTDPLVPNFGFSLSCKPEGANALRFNWYSDAGYLYDLEFSATLESPSWQTIASFGPPVRLIQYTNTIPTNSSGFYRVRSYPGN